VLAKFKKAEKLEVQPQNALDLGYCVLNNGKFSGKRACISNDNNLAGLELFHVGFGAHAIKNGDLQFDMTQRSGRAFLRRSQPDGEALFTTSTYIEATTGKEMGTAAANMDSGGFLGSISNSQLTVAGVITGSNATSSAVTR
jgi:hypothetical protein